MENQLSCVGVILRITVALTFEASSTFWQNKVRFIQSLSEPSSFVQSTHTLCPHMSVMCFHFPRKSKMDTHRKIYSNLWKKPIEHLAMKHYDAEILELESSKILELDLNSSLTNIILLCVIPYLGTNYSMPLNVCIFRYFVMHKDTMNKLY